jgi:hypothetical protein
MGEVHKLTIAEDAIEPSRINQLCSPIMPMTPLIPMPCMHAYAAPDMECTCDDASMQYYQHAQPEEYVYKSLHCCCH